MRIEVWGKVVNPMVSTATRLLAMVFILNFAIATGNVATIKATAFDVRQNEGDISSTLGFFEENLGQFDSRVKYLLRGGATEVFLTDSEQVYVVKDNAAVASQNPKTAAVYVRMSGGSSHSNIQGDNELPHRTNYFRGSDSSQWFVSIPNYRTLIDNETMDDLSMVHEADSRGRLQTTYVFLGDKEPPAIEWVIEGADDIALTSEGELQIYTTCGNLILNPPKFKELSGSASEVIGTITELFRIDSSTFGGNRFVFRFTKGDIHEHGINLLRQPVSFSTLGFSTFIGGNNSESAEAVTVDSAGASYLTGFVLSANFPTTPGVFDTSLAGADVFVTKVNSDGNSLLFSTFIGGPNGDRGKDIAVDNEGYVYITGNAESGFPTTAGAFDTAVGFADVFVTKLSPTGSSLVYSTALGDPSSEDYGNSIAVDTNGNAYVAGRTASEAFPTTPNAFSQTKGGSFDCFVTKLNATGSNLVYSTFLGGRAGDECQSLALDSLNACIVTGSTNSVDFPTVLGAFDSTLANTDVFVSKLSSDGTTLHFSTLIGGGGRDTGIDVAIDAGGSVLVAGVAGEGTEPFPTTLGAFDRIHNGINDGFLLKLNSTGSSLTFSTLVGGNLGDVVYGVTITPSGRLFVGGSTTSVDFPTTEDAFDSTYAGSQDAFLAEISQDGSDILYSTFLGGSSDENCFDIASDNTGNVYITGETNGFGFPTTPGAFDTSHNANRDVFLTKFGEAVTFSVSGRVFSPSGIPLRSVTVSLIDSLGIRRSSTTSSFGSFNFNNVSSGASYVLSASSKRYRFAPYTILVDENIADIDFVGLE